MKITYKSSDNAYLNLNNTEFHININHREEIKKWQIGDEVNVKKYTSDNPYSYELYNKSTDSIVYAVRTN